jgi:hypothetical protein
MEAGECLALARLALEKAMARDARSLTADDDPLSRGETRVGVTQ